MEKPTESRPEKEFTFAGQTLSPEGTSRRSELEYRIAEGRPVFHTVVFGGQTLSLSGTSGISHPPQTAPALLRRQGMAAVRGQEGIGMEPMPGMGQPTPGSLSRQGMAAVRGQEGIGMEPTPRMGQPTVISGTAGVYPR